MLRSLKGLHGFAIGAVDGDIGTVTDCYFDDATFTVRYVVVETGGWLADRKVLLSPTAFGAVDWEHRRIATGLNRAQVESSPDIDTQKPVSRQHETIYFGHYGVSPVLVWALSLGDVTVSVPGARRAHRRARTRATSPAGTGRRWGRTTRTSGARRR